MLTARQAELLDFLTAFEAQFGYCPSFDEMQSALRLKSKSGIHRLISGLDERGFIRRLPHRARAITTKPADSQHVCPACGHRSTVAAIPAAYQVPAK